MLTFYVNILKRTTEVSEEYYSSTKLSRLPTGGSSVGNPDAVSSTVAAHCEAVRPEHLISQKHPVKLNEHFHLETGIK